MIVLDNGYLATFSDVIQLWDTNRNENDFFIKYFEDVVDPPVKFLTKLDNGLLASSSRVSIKIWNPTSFILK